MFHTGVIQLSSCCVTFQFKERKANSAERPKSTELYRALRLRVNFELNYNFDRWVKVVGFPASAHAQGQGMPPLHSDWPKVGGKSRQNEMCEYS